MLRTGESQRKDGRYVYLDNKGRQQFLYSWKLEVKDRIPQGKRDCTALRDKIKEISKSLDSGILPAGRGYSTIHAVRGVVRPAFQLAMDDDLIRKNPFEFQLATVVTNDSVTREAITKKECIWDLLIMLGRLNSEMQKHRSIY